MNGGLPARFDLMPQEPGEYYGTIGVFMNKSARDRESDEIERDLVDGINNSSEIPMYWDGSRVAGYVLMRVR